MAFLSLQEAFLGAIIQVANRERQNCAAKTARNMSTLSGKKTFVQWVGAYALHAHIGKLVLG